MKRSAFSNCHPAVSFAFFIGAIGFGVFIQHPVFMAAGLICSIATCINFNGKKGIHNVLMLIPLWVALSIINPLFNTLGEHVLFTVFGRPYTFEALCYGMVIASMFVTMMLWFSCYNTVMTEDKFTYLFGNLAPSLALLLTMVFRLIPNLLRKAKQVMGARQCIGMGAGKGSPLKDRIEDGMTSLSVLSSWAIEGSVVTADSMNSRGYGTSKRTCFHSYCISTRDVILAVLFVLCIAATLVVVFTGGTAAEFTPTLSVAPLTLGTLPGLLAYTVFLLLPLILNLREDLIWHISKSKI